jgi:NAD(P)-dependent dehydrogenase (short-subunit alcohol dehydrogenase family)
VFRDQYLAIDPTSEALSQAGKVIIITGGSSGIGARGFAPAFAKANAKAIVLVARNLAKLNAVAAELRTTYPKVEFLPIGASVDDETAVEALFDTVAKHYGHADVLINNAGVWTSGGASITDADASQWWKDFEINLKGPFLMSRRFLKMLGPDLRGTIVTMNTGIAATINPGMSSYSLSKSASLRLVEFIAAEHPNVTAVSLQPGVVMTDMVVESFKRFALDTPELVGGTGVWLSTDNARFLTGRFISANWSVEDLLENKTSIQAGNDLKMVYQGEFGPDKLINGDVK